ncbi:MAG TPA: hypothetical protein VFL76_02590 [Edaphocola sp.]|nr:hypothetical protein [Edaphocola sp.]
MICNRVDAIPAGDTTIPIKPLIDGVINFICNYLPLFPNALKNNDISSENEVEKLLNQYLIIFFNGHSYDYNPYLPYKFIFGKDDENKGTNFKPDIGVTLWNNQTKNFATQSFFQIECKRLPIPNISASRSEKEYVIGIAKNTGGIERFKNKKHGSHLEESAIIAFIQNDTIPNWYSKINSWIKLEVDNKATNWTNNDYLTPVSNSATICRYCSFCNRENTNAITLHHFLLALALN